MNMVAPSNLDILHLLTAIATTTAISIMKSKKTEQNSPELLTTIAVPRCTALKIIQGTGNLHRKKQVQYVNLCNYYAIHTLHDSCSVHWTQRTLSFIILTFIVQHIYNIFTIHFSQHPQSTTLTLHFLQYTYKLYIFIM